MALATPAPTTELSAVNLMLAAIVTAPVNSLEGTLNADISLAINILQNTSREVQSKAWNFNTEEDFPLNVNGQGEIGVAGNILRLKLTQGGLSGSIGGNVDPVVRGSRLYDKKGHTFTFASDVNCTITFMLPFEEMPEFARNYIAIKASRKFQDKTIGSETLDGFDQGDEFDAWTTFLEADAANAEYSIFDDPDTAFAANRSRGNANFLT